VGSRLQCDDWLIELHLHRIKAAITVSHTRPCISYKSNSETQPESIRSGNPELFEACAVVTDIGSLLWSGWQIRSYLKSCALGLLSGCLRWLMPYHQSTTFK